MVRVGELVGAVTGVREGTLLAALMGWGEFAREGVEEEEEGGGEKGEEGVEEDGAKGKGKDDEDEDEEGGEEKPTKMQILVWRSEGMGQYMADELGPKFRIPKGFY